ncbi:hypothetical protein [Mucilaginibacter terrae]|uniref:Uncharacterized protein n=1 Tax=Mucilaginibacter terrae TaxID=1955052 RepID=A0ABU3H0I7_9SPHI|nr:hypothetical protein [Mucilaginibacter terrae]MDT3405201.1 hypothetical protein [Mucilaginibacter terrae]
MKRLVYLFTLTFLLGINFNASAQVNNCYISFKKTGNLKMNSADRFPAEADHNYKLNTQDGEVILTMVDGYRILYYNSKNVPFVNLKVETSTAQNYETDKRNLLAHLRYLNANSITMETKDLIELNYNGFKIYGLSRNSIESGSTLGTFVMFPGNNTIVYFYFNNLKPELSNFKNLADYQGQRNDFIGEYTSYLNNCLGK